MALHTKEYFMTTFWHSVTLIQEREYIFFRNSFYNSITSVLESVGKCWLHLLPFDSIENNRIFLQF